MDFVENLEVPHVVGGGGHVICLIMMQCIRKLICGSLLIVSVKPN